MDTSLFFTLSLLLPFFDVTFFFLLFFSMLFFFNDTATTEIYTLSLHDALPICPPPPSASRHGASRCRSSESAARAGTDRKSTRLNSSHRCISYAVFCLKKKKKKNTNPRIKQENLNKQSTDQVTVTDESNTDIQL